jgi:acetyl esterase/lipase
MKARLWTAVTLLFSFAAARAVEPGLHRDIEYGQAAGVSLRLDASVPEGDGPFPVAILVHGGGWNSGDKANVGSEGRGADISPWFAPLTAAKFTWFSINYRLAPAHRWPACFEDVQTAIRWARAHAREFKGDPARIVIFGHSAGGHLATLAGALGEGDTRVQAVVGYAPVTDFIYELPARGGLGKALQDLHHQPQEPNEQSLAILRDTAASNHVQPGLPPFLLLHGDADKTVPYQTSVNFQAKLRASGVVCDLITIPGAGHGLLNWNQFLPGYADQMTAWLREKLEAGPSAPRDITPAQPRD